MKYNYLTLLQNTHSKNGKKYADFQCECGIIKNLRVSAVTSGNTKSCGCHRKKNMSSLGKKAKTHGQTGSWLHKHWLDYYNDGLLCDDWQDFSIFEQDIGYLLSSGKRLIRLDDSKPMSLFNVKLVDSKISKAINHKKTCLLKYGIESHTQLDEVKEKIRQTNLEKYGFEYATQSPDIQIKSKKTCLEKYGAEHHMKTKEYKDRFRQITIDNDQAVCYQGKTATQWAKELELSPSTVHQRIKKYGTEIAITLPKYQSEIESLMENLLNDLNVTFKKQFKVDDYIADFYLPDYKIVIECDGLYWHSEKKKENRYHKNKYDAYINMGYRPFFFRENEIETKFEIVKSIISNGLNFLATKIFARKCTVRSVGLKERRNFLNSNHLMGTGRGKAFGLYYNDQLVCLLQYITKNGLLNIERFCPKINTSVIGGFSKLLKHAIHDDKPKIVQTFIDKRYGKGEYLKDLGFTLENESLSFVWCKNNQVFHRMKYPGNSGYKFGFYKVWDCGQAKWVKKL